MSDPIDINPAAKVEQLANELPRWIDPDWPGVAPPWYRPRRRRAWRRRMAYWTSCMVDMQRRERARRTVLHKVRVHRFVTWPP
jgi:hypothetical protein